MLFPAGLTIPDITSVDYDNELSVTLARCDLTPADDSHELVSNGSDIAIVPAYSRLTSMKLNAIVMGISGTINSYRWALVKEPDGDALISGLDDTTGLFHNSGQTPTSREYRKYVLAKGIFVTNPSSAVNKIPIYVKRSAMRRLGSFRPDDILRFIIARDGAGASASTMTGMGTLYFKANA